MKLDLLLFTDSSKKIPTSFLTGQTKKGNWRLFFAHSVDFLSAFILANFLGLLFHSTMSSILLTESLELAYLENSAFGTVTSVFPLTLFSYFFFSYLLNDGQTFGMFLMKRRVSFSEKGLRSAFYFSSHSLLLCATGGFSFYFVKPVWASFKGHDYLYQELMEVRDQRGVDLLAKTQSWEDTEEAYQRAA
jgi:hypothetical protein